MKGYPDRETKLKIIKRTVIEFSNKHNFYCKDDASVSKLVIRPSLLSCKKNKSKIIDKLCWINVYNMYKNEVKINYSCHTFFNKKYSEKELDNEFDRLKILITSLIDTSYFDQSDYRTYKHQLMHTENTNLTLEESRIISREKSIKNDLRKMNLAKAETMESAYLYYQQNANRTLKNANNKELINKYNNLINQPYNDQQLTNHSSETTKNQVAP